MKTCDGSGVIRELAESTFGLLYSRCSGCAACGHSIVAPVKCLLDVQSELDHYPGIAADVSGCGCPACLGKDKL